MLKYVIGFLSFILQGIIFWGLRLFEPQKKLDNFSTLNKLAAIVDFEIFEIGLNDFLHYDIATSLQEWWSAMWLFERKLFPKRMAL